MSYSYSYSSSSGTDRPFGERFGVGDDADHKPPLANIISRECLTHPAAWGCSLCLLGVSLLLLVILLPLSYQYVEYHDYALNHNTLPGGGGIDYGTVYTYGRYFWGVGHKQEILPRVMQNVEYKQDNGQTILAFTDSGLEFVIECSFQYRIIRDQVPMIFQNFHKSYHGQIISIGLRALKNVAPTYSLDQYISERETIQQEMYTELVSELSTLCGDTPCIEIPHPQYFQLRRVIVPQQIHETWLTSVVRVEENIAQQNRQIEILVRKETERLEAEIAANITLVNIDRDNAVSLLTQAAQAEKFRITTEAKGDGIRIVVDAIGLVSDSDIQDLLDILIVLDSGDKELKTLYRRHSVFDAASTKVVIGASDTVVTV